MRGSHDVLMCDHLWTDIKRFCPKEKIAYSDMMAKFAKITFVDVYLACNVRILQIWDHLIIHVRLFQCVDNV